MIVFRDRRSNWLTTDREGPEITGVSNYVAEDSASFIKIANIELSTSKRAVESGTKALQGWAKANKYKFAISQGFQDIFQSLIQSFENSFQVELKINDGKISWKHGNLGSERRCRRLGFLLPTPADHVPRGIGPRRAFPPI